jgi:hypothetical protein
MHWGEAGGATSMESFGNFIKEKCAKGLAETEMTMKYEGECLAAGGRAVRTFDMRQYNLSSYPPEVLLFL